MIKLKIQKKKSTQSNGININHFIILPDFFNSFTSPPHLFNFCVFYI